jgi:hypothetical protein
MQPVQPEGPAAQPVQSGGPGPQPAQSGGSGGSDQPTEADRAREHLRGVETVVERWRRTGRVYAVYEVDGRVLLAEGDGVHLRVLDEQGRPAALPDLSRASGPVVRFHPTGTDRHWRQLAVEGLAASGRSHDVLVTFDRRRQIVRIDLLEPSGRVVPIVRLPAGPLAPAFRTAPRRGFFSSIERPTGADRAGQPADGIRSALASAADTGPGGSVVSRGPVRLRTKVKVVGPFLHLPERWRDVPAFLLGELPALAFGAAELVVEAASQEQRRELPGGVLLAETVTVRRALWSHRRWWDTLVQKLSIGSEHGRLALSDLPVPDAWRPALRSAETIGTPFGPVKVECFLMDEYKPTGSGPRVLTESVTRRTRVLRDPTGTQPRTGQSRPERRRLVAPSATPVNKNELRIGVRISYKAVIPGADVVGVRPSANAQIALGLKGAMALRWLELVGNGLDMLTALGRTLADLAGVVELRGTLGVEYKLLPDRVADLATHLANRAVTVGALPPPLAAVVEQLAASIEPVKVELSTEWDAGHAIQRLANLLGLPVDQLKQAMGVCDGQILPARPARRRIDHRH